MGEVITFVVIVVIWGYCAITQIPADRKRKQYYLDKARECSMKGEDKEANMYIELASRMRCK